MAEGSKRTRAMQEAVDDELMGTDTTGMDEASRGYHELRKKHAIEHIVALEKEKELERKAATVAAAQVSLEEDAGLASATDTSTGTDPKMVPVMR